MNKLPKELEDFAKTLHKDSGRPIEEITKDLQNFDKYNLTPYLLLAKFRDDVCISLDTLIGIKKGNYSHMEMLEEDVKKKGGVVRRKSVPWEELEKHYKDTLSYMGKKGWLESKIYKGQKFYLITDKGKKENDSFWEEAKSLISKCF